MSSSSDLVVLGAGDAFITPLVANPTPVHLATVQSIQLDLSWEEVMLYGKEDLPEHVARTKAKLTGSIKVARFMRGVSEVILSGSTTTAGSRLLALSESTGSISGATYTATHASGGIQNFGVKDENDNTMKCVPSAPAAGEYSLVETTGVYTFNAAATGKTYSVSYSYADAVNGKTVSYSSQTIGAAVGNRIDIFGATDGLKYGITLFKATLPNFNAAFSTTEYAQPDLKFTAFKDSNKKAMSLYFPG